MSNKVKLEVILSIEQIRRMAGRSYIDDGSHNLVIACREWLANEEKKARDRRFGLPWGMSDNEIVVDCGSISVAHGGTSCVYHKLVKGLAFAAPRMAELMERIVIIGPTTPLCEEAESLLREIGWIWGDDE